jgi:phosphatidylglycerol:prolipoprotein diacylglycerol transferase
MHPVLAEFEIGGTTVTIAAYSAFLLLAVLASVALAVPGAARLGVSRRRAVAWYACALVAGLAGARLLDVVLNWRAYAGAPWRIASLDLQGFALYGGFALAVPVALAAARSWRVSPWALADSAIPAVTAGIVLLRVGCFLNGCCAGTAADLPWAVVFPAHGASLDVRLLTGAGLLRLDDAPVPVHPTQLYELGAALACCVLAWIVRRRGVPAGVPALVFTAGFVLFRAVNQVIRPPVPGLPAPDWFLPVLYATVAMVAGLVLAWRWRSALVPAGRLPACIVARAE